jgi:hypothetical protein
LSTIFSEKPICIPDHVRHRLFRDHAEKSGLRDPEVSAFGLPQAGAYDPGLGFAPHLVLIPDRRQLRQERLVPLLIPA